MAAPYEKTNDTQTGLLSLTDFLADVLNVPPSTFTTDPNNAARSMFDYPFVARNDDLMFESYYGNIRPAVLRPGMRAVAVARRSPDVQPREPSLDDIRCHVAQCINSVADADRTAATLMISLRQVFFLVNHDTWADAEVRFLRHGATFRGTGDLQLSRRTELTVMPQECEWQGPGPILDFLRSIEDIEETSREPTDPYLCLPLRGHTLWNDLPGKRHLKLDKAVFLNHDTLAFEKWRVQNWPTMAYYLMHARPSSYDVSIGVSVRRYVSIEELRRQGHQIPPVLAEPSLNGLLTRDGPRYRTRTIDIGMGRMHEFEPGERIHFRYRDVPFTVTLQPWTTFFYEHERREFVMRDSRTCPPYLEFSLTADRDQLIEAVTQVAHSLLLNSNDPEVLPLQPVQRFLSDNNGVLPSKDIQAVLRLKFEEGNLRVLLGLEEGASNDSCREHCLRLRTLLEQMRGRRLVKRLELNLDALMEKLALAENEIE